jgi:hypothetical protein
MKLCTERFLPEFEKTKNQLVGSLLPLPRKIRPFDRIKSGSKRNEGAQIVSRRRSGQY